MESISRRHTWPGAMRHWPGYSNCMADSFSKIKRKASMSNTPLEQTSPAGFNLRSVLFSLVLNIAIPLLLYSICKNHYHTSDVVALSVAAIFPIGDSFFEVILHR